jgi:hypothetical protein
VSSTIPIHIWETIRHLGAAELDLVDKDDEALLTMVERDVDKRIADYQRAVTETPERTSLIRFFGCLLYGTADSPRAEQVRRGMEYFQRRRQQQCEVRARIAELRERSPASRDLDQTQG